MGDFIRVTFECPDVQEREILIAFLSAWGYEGFEETDQQLAAFVGATSFNKDLLGSLPMEQLTWSITTITDTNWNALWESDFQPVVIDDFCSIRASFHPPETATKFDLVITPKMSFGTGHHATTRMMIRHMQQSNLRDASVLDFGSGTGILSILAEKMGAAAVTAIECDDQAVANAEDNFRVNHCSRISQIHDDQIQVENQYDIILANILLSVILKNLSALTKHLKKGGVLILSGLLKDDEQAILEATRPLGLVQKRRLFEEQWLGLSFEYQKVDESNFRR